MTTAISPTLKIGVFENSFKADVAVEALYQEIFKLLDLKPFAQTQEFHQHAMSGKITKIVSNRTCLSCLSNCPVYILPCEKSIQHAVCEMCAEHFSSADAQSSANISLDRCPLGCSFTTSPWHIRRKPLNAGARILTLDGYVAVGRVKQDTNQYCRGGVRGILELAILKEVVNAVGHDIPIQELFDLALGTSTGMVRS